MTSALTDTHCHLYFRDFNEDLTEVLNRAWDQGVQRILVPGIDLDTSRQAVALADSHPNLFAAIGIHPNDALTWEKNTADQLRELATHPKTLAIGEIGLDYYRDRAPKSNQMKVFEAQLAIAADCNLPVASIAARPLKMPGLFWKPGRSSLSKTIHRLPNAPASCTHLTNHSCGQKKPSKAIFTSASPAR